MRYLIILTVALLMNTALSCSTTKSIENASIPKIEKPSQQQLDTLSRAYFAAGCFWCVEAIFESVRGVEEVISGYAGGRENDANYAAVSNGVTDHAESVEIYYDPAVVTYATLLTALFGSHDPTTLNRQGPDSGRQYRSAIFYQNEEEKKLANDFVAELEAQKVFRKPITTEISKLKAFYPAEDYHQDYERRNPTQPYVRAVSIPRLNRFKAAYPQLLKDSTIERH